MLSLLPNISPPLALYINHHHHGVLGFWGFGVVGGGGGGGDGCEEYIPSQENVTNFMKTDFEADFVDLFVKLRPETRLRIGHHFEKQPESLEGQPLQGFVRSCVIGGEDCSDLR